MSGCSADGFRAPTLLFYLTNLFHRFFQDCTFVRLDVEVIDVVDVGEDQLGELFDVFILLLAVSLLRASLGAVERERDNQGPSPVLEQGFFWYSLSNRQGRIMELWVRAGREENVSVRKDSRL